MGLCVYLRKYTQIHAPVLYIRMEGCCRLYPESPTSQGLYIDYVAD